MLFRALIILIVAGAGAGLYLHPDASRFFQLEYSTPKYSAPFNWASLPWAAGRKPKPVEPTRKPDRTAPQVARRVDRVPVPVDSVAPAFAYPVASWPLHKQTAGYIDAVHLDGAPPLPLDSGAPGDDDVLQVTGWAGHKALGMHLPHVLFTVCGSVVGGTEVADARPDVARTVHSNLGRSGWTAWLAVAHLPRCDNAHLNAWAVSPVGASLWPLEGSFPLELPREARGTERIFYSQAQPLKPEDVPKPVAVVVNVLADTPMYKCASAVCDRLGSRSKGPHPGFVIETSGDWTLIQFDGASGWLQRDLFTIQDARR